MKTKAHRFDRELPFRRRGIFAFVLHDATYQLVVASGKILQRRSIRWVRRPERICLAGSMNRRLRTFYLDHRRGNVWTYREGGDTRPGRRHSA